MAYVKNAADKEQVKIASKKEKRRREKELNDIRYVLSDRKGRRLMWRYLSLCGVFKTSYSQDSNTTYFNEGQRNIGLRLLSDINEASPEVYMMMIKEEKKEKENE